MIVDPVAQSLHDKYTRGETLYAQENDHLMQWYAAMDDEEAAVLTKGQPPVEDLNKLHAQIEDILGQIVLTAQNIRAQQETNEKLRQEVDTLKKTLAHKLMPQPV